ncbi:hypothetical protein AK812_SmicGene36289 [Symbiodinium microadriaticum]|uniref:Uncharacterized protein n=1 Tax=Symbiodinium microadriaticum TaxID=2951 RepID=A0A1Q9CJB7_SYMMI|nr:hypothetical protein AK812_SmicGene36289 [Symbiodinium microadriaticum]
MLAVAAQRTLAYSLLELPLAAADECDSNATARSHPSVTCSQMLVTPSQSPRAVFRLRASPPVPPPRGPRSASGRRAYAVAVGHRHLDAALILLTGDINATEEGTAESKAAHVEVAVREARPKRAKSRGQLRPTVLYAGKERAVLRSLLPASSFRKELVQRCAFGS